MIRRWPRSRLSTSPRSTSSQSSRTFVTVQAYSKSEKSQERRRWPLVIAQISPRRHRGTEKSFLESSVSSRLRGKHDLCAISRRSSLRGRDRDVIMRSKRRWPQPPLVVWRSVVRKWTVWIGVGARAGGALPGLPGGGGGGGV